MKDMRPARPKNLATKTVAWPWASGVSIHCRQGLRMQDSLHPLRKTRHPLQLIFSGRTQCHERLTRTRRERGRKAARKGKEEEEKEGGFGGEVGVDI